MEPCGRGCGPLTGGCHASLLPREDTWKPAPLPARSRHELPSGVPAGWSGGADGVECENGAVRLRSALACGYVLPRSTCDGGQHCPERHHRVDFEPGRRPKQVQRPQGAWQRLDRPMDGGAMETAKTEADDRTTTFDVSPSPLKAFWREGRRLLGILPVRFPPRLRVRPLDVPLHRPWDG